MRTARSSRAPKIFCSSPGDTINAGTSSGEIHQARRVRPPERQVGGVVRARARQRAPAARHRHGERQRDGESRDLDGQLHDVDPGRRQETAGGKVHADRHAADDAADRARDARDHIQNPSDGRQLRGQDEQRSDPEQRGDDGAHRPAVAVFQVVADRVQPAGRRRPAASPDRSTARGSASRSPPTRPTTRRRRRPRSRARSRRPSIRPRCWPRASSRRAGRAPAAGRRRKNPRRPARAGRSTGRAPSAAASRRRGRQRGGSSKSTGLRDFDFASFLQVPRRRDARDTRGLPDGTHDRFGHHVGGQRADLSDIRGARFATRSPAQRSCRRPPACAPERSRERTRREPFPRHGSRRSWSTPRWSRRRPASCSVRALPNRMSPLRSSLRASTNVFPSAARAPATIAPVAGSTTSPKPLVATSAATVRPFGSVTAALPMPPFIACAAAGRFADRGAGPGTDAAFLRRRRRRDPGGLVAAVGGWPNGPVAHRQIEERRRRDDRHVRSSELETDALFLEIAHDAAGRIEAEGAAAGEHDGVHDLHEVARAQQVGFPGRGRRAAHVDAGGRTGLDEDHRAPGRPLRQREVADLDARHRGERAVGAWTAPARGANRHTRRASPAICP